MQTKRTVYGFMVLALVAGMALPVVANNIRVANVATGHQDVEQQQTYVAFDLSWENSWRNDVNWDAAWVFVKFRPQGSNEWQHAYLATNSASHLPAANSVITAVPDGMGVFVSRNGSYTGDVSYVNTRLLWQYGTNGYSFSRGDQVEVSVHAMEMVYVAEGAFYVGSGGTEDGSFTDGEWVSGTTLPFAISGEDELTISQSVGDLWAQAGIGDTGLLPADFPKGYNGFYCMKYPITQGQYAEYLNLLPLATAGSRYMNQFGNWRNMIQQVGEPGDYTYQADVAPDRACNFLSWLDGLYYASWAGLRPMSDLEFEKAGRGPESPVPNEYAWGTDSGVGITGHEGEDGSGEETALPIGANHTPFGSSAGGPQRVGIYATNNADRVSAGASYWGILELSSYPCERVVSVATGRFFIGSHGDGTLDLPNDWPTTGFLARSGSRTGSQNTRLSTRTVDIRHDRRYPMGARAVRTAP